ncbi:MAG: phosphoribosylanthranilate isomerase [Burkholderiaceae bacterium]
MRTRIKICGITRLEDAQAAAALGADAIGLVFYPKSPRAVGLEQARCLAKAVAPWMSVVGLFVNAERAQVLETAQAVGLSHIQLHGDEDPAACRDLGRPVVKALRVSGATTADGLITLVNQFRDDASLLFDADSSGFGGSGMAFDWQILKAVGPHLPTNWVLSGGLESGTVSQAIATLGPPAVDVSSGVERLLDGELVKGVKDLDRMKAFVHAVARANGPRSNE